MAGEPRDAVRRVELAPLSELVSITVDDVEAHMDHLLEPGTDSASLYRRWERQQWAVSDLDFTQDKADWASLPPAIRQVMQHTMTLFFIGEQAVTDTLGPILHAAPYEDERVFLATQIADEARHTVFFHRFFDEVLQVHGGLRAALETVGPAATAGFRRIFETHLADATDLVRREPENRRAWVEAIVTYHLIIEGYLALAGQRNLLRYFRSAGLMPGFTTGFTAVARDESRHIGFGVLALRRRVEEDPEMGRVVALKVLGLLEPAVLTAVNPDTRLNLPDPGSIPAELRQSPLELREFAIGSLSKRLRSVGLSDSAVDELGSEMRQIYEQLWNRYEQVHGVDHPVRWYQRQGVEAGA
jgi:ribonucleoside-diphosphate reductase beta chain